MLRENRKACTENNIGRKWMERWVSKKPATADRESRKGNEKRELTPPDPEKIRGKKKIQRRDEKTI